MSGRITRRGYERNVAVRPWNYEFASQLESVDVLPHEGAQTAPASGWHSGTMFCSWGRYGWAASPVSRITPAHQHIQSKATRPPERRPHLSSCEVPPPPLGCEHEAST